MTQQQRPRIKSIADRVQRADLSVARTPSLMKFGDARRGSRHERGYGSEWDRRRLRILKRDGYVCQCEDCQAKGLVKEATHVDHIVAKELGGSDDDLNLRAMNVACHKRKTAREARGGGRP